MSTTFELARVGDKVWDIRRGWGEIREVEGMHTYPITVIFKNKTYGSFTLDGLDFINDENRTLFWDKVEIEAPSKPLPGLEVDTKVLVWVTPLRKFNRYFSHFSPTGRIVCFADGATSWSSGHTVEWDNWELVE